MCVGCDVLEKYEDVVGQTRDQRRVCGAVGRRNGLSLWHASFCVSYGRALHCILKLHKWLYWKLIAVSMLGVFIDMSYAPGPSDLASEPVFG
jgi:hypothetical protein